MNDTIITKSMVQESNAFVTSEQRKLRFKKWSNRTLLGLCLATGLYTGNAVYEMSAARQNATPYLQRAAMENAPEVRRYNDLKDQFPYNHPWILFTIVNGALSLAHAGANRIYARRQDKRFHQTIASLRENDSLENITQ